MFKSKLTTTPNSLLYHGRLDNIPNHKLSSVRIFVSSTFSDTVEERDALIKNVYPKLREYCFKTYNIPFYYSDMRWGIQDQSTDNHSTVDMCLQELDRCCRLSLATNCVILLSHRYGGQMPPARIKQRVFRRFASVLSDDESALIDRWFQLDENPVEPVYVLRSIDSTTREQWKENKKQLQNALRHASDLCLLHKTISESEHKEFHISVTSQEIYRALQNNDQQPQRMVAFFRELKDIDDLDSKLKLKFSDTDEETQKLLDDTKTLIRDALLPENVFAYRVNWKDETNKNVYLTKFQEDFYNVLKNQIDYHMTQTRPKDKLYEEVLEHSIQCKMLDERYCSRDDILEKVKTFVLLNTPQRPCTIYGKSGTGKSSIMAQVAIKAPKWFENPSSVSIIIRFLGTTPLSSDIRQPLISIIQQICIIYHIKMVPINDSTTIQGLKQKFEQILIQIPTTEKLVILFDSVDQLQVEYYDCSKWLPVDYPQNVKCILSTIPVIPKENANLNSGKVRILPFFYQTESECLHSIR
ncbi:unnamed protein product [Rotaria magnacalcarata]|uniref:DUF4062 domain-containing protein n=3 Tax=Rotaria magnacalcarata TaxID=392030 RepID=A0A8S2P9Q2_9BILA|nr:unnamed protein product [Rotaria magnacalcarata]CAF4077440.1 unnamed protein product [Rotaria magnacalcarata]